MKWRAVIAGVDRYEDEKILDLQYAINDARRFANFIERLPNNDASEPEFLPNPSARQVRKALNTASRDLGAEDLLIFYFAGHGMKMRGQRKYLLLCPQVEYSVLISGDTNDTVSDTYLDNLVKADPFHCLFVFDLCRNELQRGFRSIGGRSRSGVMARSSSDILRDIGATPKQKKRKNICFTIWSCDDEEQSLESPDLKGGLFTVSLLDSMRSRLGSSSELQIDSALMADVQTRMDRLIDGDHVQTLVSELKPNNGVLKFRRSSSRGARPAKHRWVREELQRFSAPIVGHGLVHRNALIYACSSGVLESIPLPSDELAEHAGPGWKSPCITEKPERLSQPL